MIKKLKIENFKSIKNSGELELKNINILIGSNGAGKSNFLNFFKFLRKIYYWKDFNAFILQNGGTEKFLFYGLKNSEYLSGEIVVSEFSNNKNINNKDVYRYYFNFKPVFSESGSYFFIDKEELNIYDKNIKKGSGGSLISHFREWCLEENIRKDYFPIYKSTEILFSKLLVYHFQDTSLTSKIRQGSKKDETNYLYEDAGNIAAFLYYIKHFHPKNYEWIEITIRSVFPSFGEFILEPEPHSDYIYLKWREINNDTIFGSYDLSDGTLRFTALTTLLLQPFPPPVIILDEPEIGLHPFAIAKLAGLIQSVSSVSQVIVATQSPELISYFNPEDIMVVDRTKENIEGKTFFHSSFKRYTSEELQDWLYEYTIGELWKKNIIKGRP